MNTDTSASVEASPREALLEVSGLTVVFHTDQGTAQAVDDVSFHLHRGETLALVGESGCGKSVSALALLRLIPSPPGQIVSGFVIFDGRDLLSLPEKSLRALRGNDISMVFQEPMSSLNPVFRIGDQITAVLRIHKALSRAEARKASVSLLQQVGIPEAEKRFDDFPHQLSGGMLQRVMIAMALACTPKLLIADEPTTALDVTIQAQILQLLRELQEKSQLALLLITHDLAVVAETADRVAVMYAGRIVEKTSVEALFEDPRHPYTQGLFASLPGREKKGGRLTAIPGTVPPATHFPPGCRFHPRCDRAMPICRVASPDLYPAEAAHQTACWLYQPHPETDEPGDTA
ncbi:MAG: ABC transporter ATP-binding protein [Candidatus Hydrogenedens sp.]|nr:ABC transporter ATP-binding protein [Candidatus Hydrogenedens sp.]